MSKADLYETLNRLLTTVYRSLPIYLSYACPWTREGDEKAVRLLRQIVDDQKQLSSRIGVYIIDHYGPVDPGEYPLDFPDTHDLSLDYLLNRLVESQKQDVAVLSQCAPALQADRQAMVLAEEALGSARGYLETLEELAGEVSKSAS